MAGNSYQSNKIIFLSHYRIVLHNTHILYVQFCDQFHSYGNKNSSSLGVKITIIFRKNTKENKSFNFAEKFRNANQIILPMLS